MRLTSAQQIPIRVQRYAGAQRLGTPRILYESARDSRLRIILGPVTILIGCIITGLYNSFYKDVFSWWPVWQALLVLLVGIAWLCIGLSISITPIIAPRVRVYLCPKGLIYLKYRISVIQWDDISQFWRNIHLDKNARVSYSYTLRRRDGATFALTSNLPHIERLGRFLEREVTRHLVAQAIVDYRAGKELEFADIKVNRQGITLKSEGKLLLWRDVDRLTVDKATVGIQRKGDSWEWATLSISDIPNVGVLKKVVDTLLQEMLYTRLPQIQAYRSGFTVYFGKLGINQEGVNLNNGEGVLPWKEITSFGVGESEIIIHRTGLTEKWYTIPTRMVTDALILKDLVEYILRRKA
jgi:uncharacterized protein DUF6585